MQNITIITPTYNSIATLKQTMDSVATQRFPAYEYIIIDGASNDGTAEFAKAHGAATHVISQKDAGIADAFNKGIALATGDWIGIINSDDWYAEDTFTLFAKALKENPHADIIHGKVQYWQDNTRTEIYAPSQAKLHLEMTLNHPSVFVRRQVYERLGTFNTAYKYAMDYELLLRFLTHGCIFVTVDAVLAHMRYGGASDRYWYKAYMESARAKKVYYGFPLKCYTYLCWQIMRTGLRNTLERLGMHGIIAAVRKNMSIMKKS